MLRGHSFAQEDGPKGGVSSASPTAIPWGYFPLKPALGFKSSEDTDSSAQTSHVLVVGVALNGLHQPSGPFPGGCPLDATFCTESSRAALLGSCLVMSNARGDRWQWLGYKSTNYFLNKIHLSSSSLLLTEVSQTHVYLLSLFHGVGIAQGVQLNPPFQKNGKKIVFHIMGCGCGAS